LLQLVQMGSLDSARSHFALPRMRQHLALVYLSKQGNSVHATQRGLLA
jgi:hypothetical protein